MAELTTQYDVTVGMISYDGYLYIFSNDGAGLGGMDIYNESTLELHAFVTLPLLVTCGTAGENGIFIGTDAGIYTMSFPPEGEGSATLTIDDGTTPAISDVNVSGIATDGTNLMVTHDAGVDYITGSTVYSYTDASGATKPFIDTVNGMILFAPGTPTDGGIAIKPTPTANWDIYDCNEINASGFICRFPGTNGAAPDKWFFPTVYFSTGGTDAFEIQNNSLYIKGVDDGTTTTQGFNAIGGPNGALPLSGNLTIHVKYSGWTEIETSGAVTTRIFASLLKTGWGKIAEFCIASGNSNRKLDMVLWPSTGASTTAVNPHNVDAGWLRITRSTSVEEADTVTLDYNNGTTDAIPSASWLTAVTDTEANPSYYQADCILALGTYFNGGGSLTEIDAYFEQVHVSCDNASATHLRLLHNTCNDMAFNANCFFFATDSGISIVNHVDGITDMVTLTATELPEATVEAISVDADTDETSGRVYFATTNYVGYYDIGTGEKVWGSSAGVTSIEKYIQGDDTFITHGG